MMYLLAWILTEGLVQSKDSEAILTSRIPAHTLASFCDAEYDRDVGDSPTPPRWAASLSSG